MMYMSEKFLDAQMVSVDIETAERADLNMEEAVKAASETATKARENWISIRAKEMSEIPEVIVYETLQRAIDDQVLSGAFVLTLLCPKTKSLRRHSVSEILTDPAAFDGWDTLDPISIDPSIEKVSGKLRLKSKAPYLDSFASGAHRYQLFKNVDDCKVARLAVEVSHEDPASTVDSCVDALAGLGSLYMSGQTPFKIRNGIARHLTVNLLDYELSKSVAPYVSVAKKDSFEQKPVQLAHRAVNQINELLVNHLYTESSSTRLLTG